jgi:hypothetical protein
MPWIPDGQLPRADFPLGTVNTAVRAAVRGAMRAAVAFSYRFVVNLLTTF